MADERRSPVGQDQPGVSEAPARALPDGQGAAHVRFARVRRFRAAIKRRRLLDATWRVVVLVVGVLIILAGLAMLALPGPGWAAIFLGLAVLATEFDWAQRLLHRVRDKVQAATRKATDPRRRRRLIIVTAALLVLAAAAAWWYLDRYGLGLPF